MEDKKAISLNKDEWLKLEAFIRLVIRDELNGSIETQLDLINFVENTIKEPPP